MVNVMMVVLTMMIMIEQFQGTLQEPNIPKIRTCDNDGKNLSVIFLSWGLPFVEGALE